MRNSNILSPAPLRLTQNISIALINFLLKLGNSNDFFLKKKTKKKTTDYSWFSRISGALAFLKQKVIVRSSISLTKSTSREY